MSEDDVDEPLAQLPVGRLPLYEAARLLVALLRTAYPPANRATGEVAEAHPQLTSIRFVLACLLRADLELTHEASRHAVVFDRHRDLAEVSLEDPEALFGPLLARAVLDLAAADARAGVPLAHRTEAMIRYVGKADEQLRDRLLAAHLEEAPPDSAAPESEEASAWWERATALVPALLAHRPTPEGTRLADYVRHNCPPDRAAARHEQMVAALGAPPGPDDLASHTPGGEGRPPRAWVQVWDWSPVLPEPVTAPWEPALALLHQAKPSGPTDPRTATP